MTYHEPLSLKFNVLGTLSGATPYLLKRLGLMSCGHSEHDEYSIHCEPMAHDALILAVLILACRISGLRIYMA
ncbi:hypothetical protein N8723_04535 [Luminiphilus sp.]|nr:hypothetical protein [Luminiphilus sp.]